MSIKVNIDYDPGDPDVGIRESVTIEARIGDKDSAHTIIFVSPYNNDLDEWAIEGISYFYGKTMIGWTDDENIAKGVTLGAMPNVRDAIRAVWEAEEAQQRLVDYGLAISGLQSVISEIDFNSQDQEGGFTYTERDKAERDKWVKQLADEQRDYEQEKAALDQLISDADEYREDN